MNNNSDLVCTDCGKPCKRSLWKFWSEAAFSCEREGCASKLCSSCIDQHPLLHGSNTLAEAEICKYCKTCFQENSVLDYSRTYDDIDGNSGLTFVFVHGGTGSRAMFRAHAEELREKFGHRSVLLDLPGHGTMIDTLLTLDSCKATLQIVLREIGVVQGGKTIYVGGSLGAYIGFYLLHELQDFFSGAVLMDCGQNIGPGASLKAQIGLFFLSMLGILCTNTTLIKMMCDVSKKSKADYSWLRLFLVQACSLTRSKRR